MTKKSGNMTPGISESRSYVNLLIASPPRTIKSEAELSATQEVIDGLIDKGDLTSDERLYCFQHANVRDGHFSRN
jgi:HTH-type transcriptional regulator / antitoxin HigA